MLVLVVCIINTVALAQSNKVNDSNDVKKVKVPEIVNKSFSKDYPAIKKCHWEAEGKDFEVGFKQAGVESSVLYNAIGQKLETESEIKPSQLPVQILIYIKKKYLNYEVSEASKIENNKGVILYEAEITDNHKVKDIIFDVNGNVVKEIIQK